MERLTKCGTRKNGYVSAIGSGFGCWGKIIDRLAAYEDTGLMPEEAQKICNALAEVSDEYNCLFAFVVQCVLEKANEPPNTSLTLEELKKMDGEPVWVKFPKCPEASGWMLVDVNRHCVYNGLLGGCDFENCGKTWLAYRRKPEEGTT